jgi:hypothetical protein
MKMRIGFVSNSSSSSFCVVGIPWQGAVPFSEDDDNDHDKLNELSLEIYADDEGDAYIGSSIENMRNEQTLGEFKAFVASNIGKYTNANVSDSRVDVYVGSRYDG